MQKAEVIQSAVKEVFGDNEVYLVGGSVRDMLIGKEPKDWDFCTPLTPDEIESLVRKAGRKPYLTGKRFGTIGFKVATEYYESKNVKRWEYIEVTTYRQEAYTKNSRKPEVKFITDIDSDLSRRDFTINAIALKNDDYYDPFGGRLDLLSRQLVSVGLPKDRIQEDPLRMLRAARFASQLDFGVDPNFVGKMRHLASTIVTVSKERWVQELDKMLLGKNPMRGIKILMQGEVMRYILPEVYITLLDDEAYQSLARTFEKYPDMDINSRWAVFLNFIGYPYAEKEKKGEITFPNHDIIRGELLQGICARLKFSNERRDALLKNKIIFKTVDLS